MIHCADCGTTVDADSTVMWVNNQVARCARCVRIRVDERTKITLWLRQRAGDWDNPDLDVAADHIDSSAHEEYEET